MIRNAHWFLALWVVMASTLVSCGVAESTPSAGLRGADTRESLVDAYLAAVAARDIPALTALTDPAVDARTDIVTLVGSSGGANLPNRTISWRDEFGGVYVIATVTGADATSSRPITLIIPISRKSGRFYLALGQANLSGSDSLISSPVPTSS